MKILIYVNKEKDKDSLILNKITSCLISKDIDFNVVYERDFVVSNDYNAIFIIGGDGSILGRTETANELNIPIIGFNAGKLGFLTEFEASEIDYAVDLLLNDQLITDKRATLTFNYNNKRIYALNDVLVQRLTKEGENCATTTLKVLIDGIEIDKVRGDGVIVSTATGSTAYSLSAGGPILAPKIDAFIITPVCAHSFNNRPVVFSSNSIAEIEYVNDSVCGIYADGKFIGELKKGDKIKIEKSINTTDFLRKKDYNFFKRLSLKFKNGKEV